MSFNTIIDWNTCSDARQRELLMRPAISASESISRTVAEILDNVKARGDDALREYSAKFDKTEVGALQVTEQEIIDASNRLGDDIKQAMAVAVKTLIPSTPRKSCRPWMLKPCPACDASRSRARLRPSASIFPAALRRFSPPY